MLSPSLDIWKQEQFTQAADDLIKQQLCAVRLGEIPWWWCNSILPGQTFFCVGGKLLNIQDVLSAGKTSHTVGKPIKLMR